MEKAIQWRQEKEQLVPDVRVQGGGMNRQSTKGSQSSANSLYNTTMTEARHHTLF